MVERAGFSIIGVFENPDGLRFEAATSKAMWLIGERYILPQHCGA
jgi:hypothetical protein